MFKKLSAVCLILAIAAAFVTAGCKSREKTLGTKKTPVVLSFMPSADPSVMKENGDIIAKLLSAETGLAVEADVALDYITIIDKLGGKKSDVAFLNSLGYLLSRDWSGAQAVFQLKGIDGLMEYQSAMISNTSSGINSLEALNGKSFAFTDPYSMAGYIMPLYMFKKNGIKPNPTSFLGNYNQVIESIYTAKINGGAIYYHRPDPYGRIRDAREKLIPKYQDMLDKVQTIAFSEPIPNTPIVFRKDLNPEVKQKLVTGLTKLSDNSEIITALGKMYDATGYGAADEKAFDGIADVLKSLGKSAEEVVPGALTFYKTHIWNVPPEY